MHWLVVDSESVALCSAARRSFLGSRGVALDTCHLPMKYEAVASNHKSESQAPGSQMLRRVVSKFNVELPQGSPRDLCTPFNGDATRLMDKREQSLYTHLCTSSLPRVEMADVRSARAWTDRAGPTRALVAVATMFPNELKNKNSRKGKSRFRFFLMAAATFGRFEWYKNNARIRRTLSARQSTLMASGTCGNDALHAELRGVFRQVYNVSLPTFRVKLDIFHPSKLMSFDAARRTPLLRQMSQGRVREVVVQPMKLHIIKVTYFMSFDCSVFIVSQTSTLRSDSCESAGSISDQRGAGWRIAPPPSPLAG